MERQLLGVYKHGKATIRIYTGQMSDTPKKRQTLFESAGKNFIKALHKRNPELLKRYVTPRPNNTK